MSIDLDLHFLILSFTNPSLVELSVTTGVGGCGCPIYRRAIISADLSWQLTNNAPISASMSLASKIFIAVHSTWIGFLRGGGHMGGLLVSRWGSKVVSHPCSSLGPWREEKGGVNVHVKGHSTSMVSGYGLWGVAV